MATTLESSDEARINGQATPAARNGKPETPPSQAAASTAFWRSSAPRKLRDGGLEGDAAWQVYWSERTGPTPIANLCGGQKSPLNWALNRNSLSGPSEQLLKFADALAKQQSAARYAKGKPRKQLQAALRDWLQFAKSAPPEPPLAVSCLAAAHIVGGAGQQIDGLLGWEVVDLLTRMAAHAAHWQIDVEAPAEQVLAHQLLAGELPLTLSYYFPEMRPLHALRPAARTLLFDSLDELLNGRGLPRAAHIAILRPLVACWTRSAVIGAQLKNGRWPRKIERQYQWVVRQALRFTAGDGTPLLAEDKSDPWSRDFLRAALHHAGKSKDAAAAREMLGAAVKRSSVASRKTPETSDDCEWSCLAVLRSGWSAKSTIAAVDYSQPEMKLDVWANGRRVFLGPWTFAPQMNSKPLKPDGAWEELCWFSDKDVDYLEFNLDLTEGARLERQIVLARREGFLLLVDHLKAPETTSLRHDWQLPLAPGVLFCGESETRDALLVEGGAVARLMPLALPEWRIDPRVGELTSDGKRVRLSQEAAARSLACPLFVDLRARRAVQPGTWRQLTVAESLVLQPPDAAVAYRIQSGRRQWVYYRSQGRIGNRTFMGQNTSSESMIARFLPKTGGVEELVEIEG